MARRTAPAAALEAFHGHACLHPSHDRCHAAVLAVLDAAAPAQEMPRSHDVTDPRCTLHDPGALEAERLLGELTECLPVGTCCVCGGG